MKKADLEEMLWAAQDKLDKNTDRHSNSVARAMIHEIMQAKVRADRRREWERLAVPKGRTTS